MIFDRCYSCMRKLPTPGAMCPHCGVDNQELNRRQPRHALPCGSELAGRYIIGRVLGQGGFGITYIAWNSVLDTRVCVKEYFPEGVAARDRGGGTTVYWYRGSKTERNRRGYENFITEARRAARVRDLPSVVRIWDAFQANDTAYIVMDFIDGVTLKEHLIRTGKPLSEAECADLFCPVMGALAEIHKRGIIHRDISPDNLMLCPDGRLALLDLGAAKDLNMGSGQSSYVVARRGFSPLEQYTQKSEIGPWTDVYALCATMIYCMTGKLLPEPLERYGGKRLDLSAFSQTFAAALEKGLAIEPARRTQNMQALSEEIRTAVKQTGEPVKLTTEPAEQRKKHTQENKNKTSGIKKHADQRDKQDKPTTGGQKKKRFLPVMIVALLIAAAGIFCWHFFGATEPQSPTAALIEAGRENRDAGEYGAALEYYIQAVEAGDSSVMDEIGRLFSRGWIPAEDEAGILQRFTLSADNGNGAAMTAIGALYVNGMGVKQDRTKARVWYKKGMDAGDAMAMVCMGRLYQDEPEQEDAIEKAVEMYEMAARGGYAAGMTHLANLYLSGTGVEKDYAKALEWYRKAERKGDSAAKAQLAYMYFEGFGVEKDHDKALDYYQQAAEAGETGAMLWLGTFCQNGYGIEQNYAMALRWYQKAYAAGEVSAANQIGSILQLDGYEGQNYAKAMEWYQIGADCGDPASMHNIGFLYQNGLGCKQDCKTAIKWYEKSAEAGGTPALTQLGYIYFNGLGVGKDQAKAFTYYKQAAEAQDTAAMYSLGLMYQYGAGTKADRDAALRWYETAATAGYPLAVEKLREIGN